MNKKIFFIGAIALLSFTVLSSCKNDKKKTKTTSEAKEVTTKAGGTAFAVDTKNSTIFWVGSKPLGAGSHDGIVAVSAGEVNIENDKILSGSFEFDLNNIICLDLEDEKMNGMLVGHLKSEDFFDVEKFPKGEFTITSTEVLSESDSCLISGNLKLKDIEKNLSFKAKIEKEENGYTAKTGTFEINRTDFGVNYNSKNIFKNLKDNIINDEISIRIEISVKK